MQKRLASLIGIFLLLLLACSTIFAAETATQELVILHTNDTHGHPLKFTDNMIDGVGGLPARATLVKQIRAAHPNVLLLDAGDFNTGRPESNFFKAEPDLKGMEYMGYDAITLGNHEFDNSIELLKKQVNSIKTPFISANVKTKDGKYLNHPYIIKEFKGFKVAIFGLTTKETETISNPEVLKHVIIEDEVATAKKLVPELRKRADIVIALVHLGIYEDAEKGSKKLAKEVPGIDLIIDGHTHTQIAAPIYVNNVPIVQDYQWGIYLGKATLTISNKKVTGLKWEAIPINVRTQATKPDGTKELKYLTQEIPEDPELLALLKPYAERVNEELAKVIGEAEDIFPQQDVRKKETAIGNLVADATLWGVRHLNVDFAIQNSGGIRTSLPKGPITKRHIYEVSPFDNSLVVVSLKGTDVQALFDFIATIPQGKGGFPQVSEGVKFTINYTTGKCENVLINGQPIDPNRTYRIATNSFTASGGDGYDMFKNATDKYDSSLFMRDVIIDYIINFGGKLKPELKGRIEIIGEKQAFNAPVFMPKAA
ncbi:MAG TPA: 5'-nucleotidase C-terminal domain-containing protein [Bacillota bacterium]|nr:5'-nucleotidase C-terminal domain-containing protein [Bacillota bacterium]HPT88639.1 5'-nucleotidase C-terminal domain-containing protein [Bacillota bacterium]